MVCEKFTERKVTFYFLISLSYRMYNGFHFAICFQLLFICFAFKAQPSLSIQNSLDSILKLDQDARNQIDRVLKDIEFQDSILDAVGLTLPQFLQYTMEKQAIQDEQNLAWIKQFIQTNGYPGKTMVGEKYAEVAWLVLQHGGQDDLKMFLPLIKDAYLHGEIDPLCYAKSKDRVLIGENRAQLYGTQLSFDSKIQTHSIYKIRFDRMVNTRRKKLGLEDVESYLYLNFKLDYKKLEVVKP
jgi:hypothetical protein